jgi:hypothetical protein
MTPSNAKVLVADVRHVACTKATHVTSTKTAHVASAKAAHMAPATATVPSASAAAGLCARGKKAAGKHCAC